MPKNNEIKRTTPDFVIYETDDKIARVSVRLEEETVWLTQAHLAELFQTSRPNITMHIRNILEDGELQEVIVCKNFLHTTEHGAIEGKISHQQAVEKAEKEFEIYRQREMRQLESDFDRAVKALTEKNKRNET